MQTLHEAFTKPVSPGPTHLSPSSAALGGWRSKRAEGLLASEERSITFPWREAPAEPRVWPLSSLGPEAGFQPGSLLSVV